MSETVSVAKKIPTFATEEEAREFWDTHSSADYWDEMEDVTNNPPADLLQGPGREGSTARKRPASEYETVSFPLLRTKMAEIRAIAERERIPADVLLRWWIADRLAQERGETPGK